MPKCQYCGKKYRGDERFCQQCGAPFQYGYPQPGSPQYAQYSPSYQPPRRSGCAGKGCLIAVVILIILGIISAIVGYYFLNKYGYWLW
jgi:uncharacterized membrane protein YvbJ